MAERSGQQRRADRESGTRRADRRRGSPARDRQSTSATSSARRSKLCRLIRRPARADKSLGTWLVSDALGAPQTFSCAGPHLAAGHAPGALLQALQRHPAEIHPRALCRHRDPEEFRQPDHADRSGTLGESRCPDLHESSAALSRRNVLSGRISKGRLRHRSCRWCTTRASSRLTSPASSWPRDCSFNSAIIWSDFRAGEEQRSHETLFPFARLRSSPSSGWRSSWLPPKTANGRCRSRRRSARFPCWSAAASKPLDTVARNSLLIIHGKQNAAARRRQAARARCNG